MYFAFYKSLIKRRVFDIEKKPGVNVKKSEIEQETNPIAPILLIRAMKVNYGTFLVIHLYGHVYYNVNVVDYIWCFYFCTQICH